MTDALLADLERLPAISRQTAGRYERCADQLVMRVAATLEARADLAALIGHNPLALMHDFLHHHAQFMSVVLRMNAFALLARTQPWVYRVYRARGFADDYFPIHAAAWQTAILAVMDDDADRRAILEIYGWLATRHALIAAAAGRNEGIAFGPDETSDVQRAFLALLLASDTAGCIKLAEDAVPEPTALPAFYEQVVAPSLHEIGRLWESSALSVADEHLATAVVGRVMAAIYGRLAGCQATRGRAIVSAAPNEFHEIGARMVADCLELDGWDVSYLGPNVPAADVVALAKRQRPAVVVLSVALAANLNRLGDLLEAMRRDPETRDVKVVVGGLAFRELPDVWQHLGADAYAPTLQDAVRACKAWEKQDA